MSAQVDSEGNQHLLFKEIVDHRTAGSKVKGQDASFIHTSSETKRHGTTFLWNQALQRHEKRIGNLPMEGWKCDVGHAQSKT